jgi:hypothetical protein
MLVIEKAIEIIEYADIVLKVKSNYIADHAQNIIESRGKEVLVRF